MTAASSGIRINHRLKLASSSRAVVEIAHELGHDFSESNGALALHKLGSHGVQALASDQVDSVLRVVQRLLPTMQGSHVATCVMAYSRIAMGAVDRRVWFRDALLEAVDTTWGDPGLVPRELADLSWGLVQLDQQGSTELQDRVGRAVGVGVRSGQLCERSTARLLWAAGSASVSTDALAELGAVAVPLLPSFSPQDTANMLWALAKGGPGGREAAEAGARQAAESMALRPRQWAARHVSAAAWATAVMGCRESKAVMGSVEAWVRPCSKLGQDGQQALANIVWAFAAVQHRPDDLEAYSAVASTCSGFLPQEAAMLATSFLALRLPKTSPFWGSLVEQCKTWTDPRAVSQAWWALAGTGVEVDFAALAATPSFEVVLQSTEASAVLWSLTLLTRPPPEVVRRAAEACGRLAPTMPPKALALAISACQALRLPVVAYEARATQLLDQDLPLEDVAGAARVCDLLRLRHPALDRLAMRACAEGAGLGFKQQVAVLGACATLAVPCNPLAAEVRSRLLSGGYRQDSASVLSIAAWALAMLGEDPAGEARLHLLRTVEHAQPGEEASRWLQVCESLEIEGHDVEKFAASLPPLAQESSVSQTHMRVSAALREMGVEHSIEVPLGRRVVDIFIPDKNMVLEVDGPSHFTLCGQLSGQSLFRNRVLEAQGYTVRSLALKGLSRKQDLEMALKPLLGDAC